MKTKIQTIAVGIVLLTLALAGAAQAGSSLANNLVVHLTFDGDLKDSSGNNNNGAPFMAPTFEAGKIGQAVHLNVRSDGSATNYVTINYPTQLKLGSDATGDASDFSFSFWAKILFHQADQPYIANKDWDSGSNLGFVLANEDDGMKWNYKDDVNPRRDSPHVASQLEDGNWHHVAVTFVRKGSGSIYVDGSLVNQASIAPDAGNAVGSVDTDGLGFSFSLGEDGRGTYEIRDTAGIEMLMDDLGIWRRALTGTEVFSIYSGGLVLLC